MPLGCTTDGGSLGPVCVLGWYPDVMSNFMWPDGHLMPLPRPQILSSNPYFENTTDKHPWDQISFQICPVQSSRSAVIRLCGLGGRSTKFPCPHQLRSLLTLMSDLPNGPWQLCCAGSSHHRPRRIRLLLCSHADWSGSGAHSSGFYPFESFGEKKSPCRLFWLIFPVDWPTHTSLVFLFCWKVSSVSQS